jgi:hypothetical protein
MSHSEEFIPRDSNVHAIDGFTFLPHNHNYVFAPTAPGYYTLV